jgi:hypothetical protein
LRPGKAQKQVERPFPPVKAEIELVAVAIGRIERHHPHAARLAQRCEFEKQIMPWTV